MEYLVRRWCLYIFCFGVAGCLDGPPTSTYHEAGHTVVTRTLQPGWFRNTQVFDVPTKLESGRLVSGVMNHTDHFVIGLVQLEDSLAIDLAGMAAEMLVFNKTRLVPYETYDFEDATGEMCKILDLSTCGCECPPADKLSEDKRVKTDGQRVMEAQRVRARGILEERQDFLIELAKALYGDPDHLLTAEEVDDLEEQFPHEEDCTH